LQIENTASSITDYNKFMHRLRTILVNKQVANLQVQRGRRGGEEILKCLGCKTRHLLHGISHLVTLRYQRNLKLYLPKLGDKTAGNFNPRNY
jgi:hypothetical protein